MAVIVEHNKYNSSRIYKIQSSLTDKIYIGSTCQALSQRMAGHISDYKKYLKDNTKGYVSSYEIIKLGDAFITLIEEFNLNNRQQLISLEGEMIKDNINICVNTRIEGRTQQQWKVDNKLIIAEKQKVYDVAHREFKNTKDRRLYSENRIQILEQAKQTINCICGSKIRIDQLARHKRNLIHQSYIIQQFINELTYYTF